MSIYKKHVFVCTGGKTCPTQGSMETFFAMKNLVKELGLKSDIRINKAGCMGECGSGPMVVVYPDAVWYAGVNEEGGRRIVNEHLVSGRVVEALLHHR
ncbi:MAG: (2Fe-2S) ferredoxin domain-containing protein [Acidobacteriota bacterium]|nr:(2Fe-2S) ferredoxin domain-containing protein [Blastocatellia bacterium]MDW8412324.1 (2Fe-2S) ferredoxin domain-containing protein [Acidobacteriota bacterium]